jgi:hypothetical protein
VRSSNLPEERKVVGEKHHDIAGELEEALDACQERLEQTTSSTSEHCTIGAYVPTALRQGPDQFSKSTIEATSLRLSTNKKNIIG